jgi:CHAT domain-containing protein
VFDRYPSRRLRFAPARFVLPAESPASAAGEIDAIRTLLQARRSRQAIISTLGPLATLIERGRFGLLHFACHNGLSNAIVLDDEFTPLLMERNRIDRTLARSSPFVFINACGSARGVPGYNRLDSWATAFLDAGAGAFAGSLWDVRDRTAKDFAEALYSQLVGGRTLGEAALIARRLAASSGDPTWLAYAIYGDADAKVERTAR